MVKKIISCLVAIAILTNFSSIAGAQEETIKIEGEWFDTEKAGFGVIADWIPGTSGNKFFQIWQANAPASPVSYTFEAEKAGYYDLELYATRSDLPVYHSPYAMYVNGRNTNLTYQSVFQGELNKSTSKVLLRKGTNTVDFVVTAPRSVDKAYVFFLDCFSFTHDNSLSYVEPVSVEGEWLDAEKAGFGVAADWIPGASGNKFFQLWTAEEGSYGLTYEVYAPKAGMYGMDIFATMPNNPYYHSPYTTEINGTAYTVAAKSVFAGNDLLHNYGIVKLKAGLNTVKFNILSRRAADGSYVFMLDRFILTYEPSIPISAEENVCSENIRIEAESQPNDAEIQQFDSCSGGAMIQVYMAYGADEEEQTKEITYTVEAQTAGYYDLITRYGLKGHNQATDLKVSVNGSEYEYIDDTTASAYEDGFGGDMGASAALTKKMNNRVYLSRGANTVKYLVCGSTVSPWDENSKITAQRIDYFELKLAEPDADECDIASAKINVNNALLKSGDTIELSAEGINRFGGSVEGCEVSFTSSNENVARISGNTLIAAGIGGAEIEAAVTKDGKTATVTGKVNVYKDASKLCVVDKSFDGATASLKIINADAKNKQTFDAVYAVYDGNKLKSVTAVKNLSLNTSMTDSISIENADFEEGNASKIYLWDSVGTLVPLSDTIE